MAISPPHSARIGLSAAEQMMRRATPSSAGNLASTAHASTVVQPAATAQAIPLSAAIQATVPRTLRLTRPLVAFDLETTGVSRQTDQIIEFGAIKRFPDGRPDEKKLLRFKPSCPISPFALRAHGISAFEVRHAPRFAVHAAEISEFLRDCDFVGHNLKRFDIPMLGSALGRVEGKTYGFDFYWPPPGTHVLDTLDLFRRFVPDKMQAGGNHKLGTCYAFYTGQPLLNAHSALADSQACMDVAEAMAAASIAGVRVGLAVCRDTVATLDQYGRTPTISQSVRRNRWQGRASAQRA